ncbi:MAG: lamin tail domain-containing protein [Candidatus Cloacimonadota bacterium]|nr:lamin tail domain-containing protein [Candidatus Cloacimonadota bacterium]
MKFVKVLLVLTLGLLLMTGCSDDDTTEPEVTEINLVINEFMASNDYGPVDENEDHDDWIEIFNAGEEAVDIGGMYITDDLDTLTVYQIPTTNPTATTIEAGGFLLLWADKEPDQGILHLDEVKLSGDGEQIGLTDVDGVTILDSLTFGEQTTDVSYGRVPDGADSWGYFGDGYDSMSSPGAANGSGETPLAVFVINEFLASNDTCYVDNYGEYDDWIEIYNAGNIAGDIGGMYFTDNLEELMTSQIPTTYPDSTTIYPGEFLIVWADKDPEQGILHLDDVKLSGGGEQVGLTAADGVTILDSLTYGEQEADISFGRLPNGGIDWQLFEVPTPGASNE